MVLNRHLFKANCSGGVYRERQSPGLPPALRCDPGCLREQFPCWQRPLGSSSSGERLRTPPSLRPSRGSSRRLRGAQLLLRGATLPLLLPFITQGPAPVF